MRPDADPLLGRTDPSFQLVGVHSMTRPSILTPREMVTDAVLRELYRSEPCQQYGELSLERQRLLAMYLPDLMGELLAYRLAERANDLVEGSTDHRGSLTRREV